MQLDRHLWFSWKAGLSVALILPVALCFLQTVRTRVLTKEEMRDFDGLWKQWDTDGNGVLDTSEFKRALRSLKIDAEHADAIYEEIDTNNNGHIEKDEFMVWFFSDQVCVPNHVCTLLFLKTNHLLTWC